MNFSLTALLRQSCPFRSQTIAAKELWLNYIDPSPRTFMLSITIGNFLLLFLEPKQYAFNPHLNHTKAQEKIKYKLLQQCPKSPTIPWLPWPQAPPCLPFPILYLTIMEYRYQLSFLRLSTYNQMQNIPYGSSKTLRLERMSSLRSSMKQISLLSKKTIELQSRLASRKELLLEKMNTSDDTASHESDNSEHLDGGEINSFLQKYELLQKLGEGANACVYRCRHRKTGKLYAAKKLKIEEEHILELKRNFFYLKELRHPSIIKYKALFLDLQQHCAYLIMECFDKPSLSECNVKDQGELKGIVRELVKSIQYLHNRNICHRDIKPQNVLYCPKTKVLKIIDFGISKKTFQRGARRDMLTVIGTHFYQAPEVYLGGGYDERIDLWALGITIFKLVTGYTPFESEYHSTTIQRITTCQVKFDAPIWNSYSSFCRDFIGQLLRKKDQRMTIKEAINHIWLSGDNKLKRSRSHVMKISEEFHDEIHCKMTNALSREEETKKSRKLVSRRIELINRTEFELSDSEGQSQPVRKITRFYSCEDPLELAY